MRNCLLGGRAAGPGWKCRKSLVRPGDPRSGPPSARKGLVIILVIILVGPRPLTLLDLSLCGHWWDSMPVEQVAAGWPLPMWALAGGLRLRTFLWRSDYVFSIAISLRVVGIDCGCRR